jgi:Ran GTPase-activating protein (RanGAP) involved in mRNA processing and transport
MSDDRYRKIFDDLTSDLFAVAKKHGKRALREAVRDAANGNLIQEDEDDIPPEELDYPDEDVWTLPPAPEDDGEDEEDTDDGDDELSEAAERVASELAEKLERRLRK